MVLVGSSSVARDAEFPLSRYSAPKLHCSGSRRSALTVSDVEPVGRSACRDRIPFSSNPWPRNLSGRSKKDRRATASRSWDVSEGGPLVVGRAGWWLWPRVLRGELPTPARGREGCGWRLRGNPHLGFSCAVGPPTHEYCT